MPVNGKMKILAALTFVGVVLMTISFASPGWVIIKADGNSYDYFVREHKVKVYLSAGLWYFSLCFNSTNLQGVLMDGRRPYIGPVERNGCYVGNYIQSPNRAVEETFLKLTKDWLLEMRIWSSVGIFSAALGFIGTIVAIRHMMRSKCSGIVAFVSLSVSVGSFVAAMAKTLIATNYNKGTIMLIYYIACGINFQCPWGLIIGAIGSLFVVISAIGHLCFLITLIRNKTKTNVQVYQNHKGTNVGANFQHLYPTVAPTGYLTVVGLKVPLVDSMEKNEEAGYLSDRKKY